jgi:hypothetical protein
MIPAGTTVPGGHLHARGEIAATAHSGPAKDRVADDHPNLPDVHRRASDRVRQVIVAAARVVDDVAPAASRLALEAAELLHELRVVDEDHAAGVQQREKLLVQRGAVLVGLIIADAVQPEPLPRPLIRVVVANDPADVIGLQQCAELGHNGVGRVGRPALPQHVNVDRVPLPVRDAEGEAVAAAAADGSTKAE